MWTLKSFLSLLLSWLIISTGKGHQKLFVAKDVIKISLNLNPGHGDRLGISISKHKPQEKRSDKDLPYLQWLPAWVPVAVSASPQETPSVVPVCDEQPGMV